MTNQDNFSDDLKKTFEAGPTAEISYICDEKGATKTVIKGNGAAVMLGILTIMDRAAKSASISVEEFMLHLLRMNEPFQMINRLRMQDDSSALDELLRKKEDKNSRGNA